MVMAFSLTTASVLLLLPRGDRWQKFIELGYQGRFVGSSKLARKEFLQAFPIKPLPRFLFMPGVDGEEKRIVGARCFHIARSIADHQHTVGGILAGGGDLQVLLLRSQLLPRDGADVPINLVLCPLFDKSFSWSGRDNHRVCL